MSEKREYLVITNFGKYQHYQTGKNASASPQWLKLYRTLRSDPDWCRLKDAAKAHFVGLLMLAPDTHNCTLLDAQYLTNELHCTEPFQHAPLIDAQLVRVYRGRRPRNFLGAMRAVPRTVLGEKAERPRKVLGQKRREEIRKEKANPRTHGKQVEGQQPSLIEVENVCVPLYGYFRERVDPKLEAVPDPDHLRDLAKFEAYVQRHHPSLGSPDAIFRRITDFVASDTRFWNAPEGLPHRSWVGVFGAMTRNKLEKRIGEAFARGSDKARSTYRDAAEVIAEQDAARFSSRQGSS